MINKKIFNLKKETDLATFSSSDWETLFAKIRTAQPGILDLSNQELYFIKNNRLVAIFDLITELNIHTVKFNGCKLANLTSQQKQLFINEFNKTQVINLEIRNNNNKSNTGAAIFNSLIQGILTKQLKSLDISNNDFLLDDPDIVNTLQLLARSTLEELSLAYFFNTSLTIEGEEQVGTLPGRFTDDKWLAFCNILTGIHLKKLDISNNFINQINIPRYFDFASEVLASLEFASRLLKELKLDEKTFVFLALSDNFLSALIKTNINCINVNGLILGTHSFDRTQLPQPLKMLLDSLQTCCNQMGLESEVIERMDEINTCLLNNDLKYRYGLFKLITDKIPSNQNGLLDDITVTTVMKAPA